MLPKFQQNPLAPQPLRDGILAVIIGGILGVLLVIGKEQILMPIEQLRERRNIDPTSHAYRKPYIENVIMDAIQQQKEKSIYLYSWNDSLRGFIGLVRSDSTRHS